MFDESFWISVCFLVLCVLFYFLFKDKLIGWLDSKIDSIGLNVKTTKAKYEQAKIDLENVIALLKRTNSEIDERVRDFQVEIEDLKNKKILNMERRISQKRDDLILQMNDIKKSYEDNIKCKTIDSANALIIKYFSNRFESESQNETDKIVNVISTLNVN